MSIRSRSCRRRRRLAASAAQEGAGPARTLRAKVSVSAGTGGKAPSRTSASSSLTSRRCFTLLGRSASETLGGASEARERLACLAPPIPQASPGKSLTSCTRASTFGAFAARMLAARCAAAGAVGTGGAATLAIAVSEAEHDALQRVKPTGEIIIAAAARCSSMSAAGHGGKYPSPRPLRRVVPLQAARRRRNAEDDSGVGSLPPAAAVPRRLPVSLRRGVPVDSHAAEGAEQRSPQALEWTPRKRRVVGSRALPR